jgi:hypothetical protein
VVYDRRVTWYPGLQNQEIEADRTWWLLPTSVYQSLEDNVARVSQVEDGVAWV